MAKNNWKTSNDFLVCRHPLHQTKVEAHPMLNPPHLHQPLQTIPPFTSSSTDERESRGKHDKRRYACTSHAEKRAPKVYGNKYGRHHSSKRKRHHRSRATSLSSSSSEDDSTYHKSSCLVYRRLPAIHSVPAIPINSQSNPPL